VIRKGSPLKWPMKARDAGDPKFIVPVNEVPLIARATSSPTGTTRH